MYRKKTFNIHILVLVSDNAILDKLLQTLILTYYMLLILFINYYLLPDYVMFCVLHAHITTDYKYGYIVLFQEH